MSSTDPAPDAPAPRIERRRHRGWRVAWRVAFATVFAAWSLLLLAWLTLQWGIVPRVGQWKPQIEQRASAALGVPVTIGAIRVQSSGWMPLIELDDVVLAPRSAASTNAGSGEALANVGFVVVAHAEIDGDGAPTTDEGDETQARTAVRARKTPSVRPPYSSRLRASDHSRRRDSH